MYREGCTILNDIISNPVDSVLATAFVEMSGMGADQELIDTLGSDVKLAARSYKALQDKWLKQFTRLPWNVFEYAVFIRAPPTTTTAPATTTTTTTTKTITTTTIKAHTHTQIGGDDGCDFALAFFSTGHICSTMHRLH